MTLRSLILRQVCIFTFRWGDQESIITVNAGTVWIVGDYYNVTWSTADAPPSITNIEGQVVLATNGVEDGGV